MVVGVAEGDSGTVGVLIVFKLDIKPDGSSKERGGTLLRLRTLGAFDSCELVGS